MTVNFDFGLLAGVASALTLAGLALRGDYLGEGWGLKNDVREF